MPLAVQTLAMGFLTLPPSGVWLHGSESSHESMSLEDLKITGKLKSV